MHHNNIPFMYILLFGILFVLSQSCPDNCADCTPDGNTCYACQPYYQLSIFNKCIQVKIIQQCTLYGPNNQCFACQPSFGWKNGLCLKDYSGCTNTNANDGSCFECGFGTLLQNGKCIGTINCANSQKLCSKCASGFQLKNSKCYPLHGCKNFDQSLGVCKQCTQGFDLVGYRCLEPTRKIYDCYIYNDNFQCQLCKNGYVSYRNQCVLSSYINQNQNGRKSIQQIIAEKKAKYQAGTSQIISIPSVLNCQVINPQDNSQCLICIYGYYPSLNNRKQCLNVSEFCETWDVSNGNCFTCKYGLILSNGACKDSYCQTYQGLNCKLCKNYFSLNNSKVCAYSDPNCVNKGAAKCIQCATNYKLNSQGFCDKITDTLKIDHCKVIDQVNKICALCQDRYYRSKSQCLLVNSICKDYDMSNGKCKSCIDGYSFTNNQCIKISTNNQQQSGSDQNQQQPNNIQSQSSTKNTTGGGAVIVIDKNQNDNLKNSDPNCLKFQSSKCTQCSNRYYVGLVDGKCVPVNPICDGYNDKGSCTSCFKGYKISGTVCIASLEKDPYCKQLDANNFCKSCFTGYFLNSKISCQPLNPLCKTSDMKSGKCLSCYQGYSLTDGTCKVFVKDPNCQQHDLNNICTKCPFKFFLSSGNCKQVSPLCKDYDSKDGKCTSCYPGYVLLTGQCAASNSQNDDINCQKRQNGACVSCYDGYYLSSITKKCIIQNLLCKTIDQSNGYCKTCYEGYVLQSSNCVIATQQTTDLNCQKFNPNNPKKCIDCYQGYFIAKSTGLCTQIDPLCKTNDQNNGNCLSCYGGYNLINSKCVVNSPLSSQNSDPYCVKVLGSKCLECNKGYFLTTSNVCTQADALCKTFSQQNGACLTCFQGYILNYGKCIVGQDLYIPFCTQVNSAAKCVQCIDRYYLSGQNNCKSVEIVCDTYDKKTGKCLTCIGGHVLQDQTCIYPALGIDPACTYYTNSFCSACKLGYYLSNYVCSQIDNKCSDFDYNRSVCKTCLVGTPQGPYCI